MASISNISSKYNDIISKSVRISSGSPHVYQLSPKKEKLGTMTRMTLGEKKVGKINKTIFFVGETGAGKSSLINAMVNYAMGVKWVDNLWFEIVEGENRESENQTASQTSDVIVYEIFGFEDITLPFSLTLIDTPGFGDTRGATTDVIVSQRLCELLQLEDGVHEADAVALVLKASDNRLSDRLRYVFNSLMSLFGKDMEEKILNLITHSGGEIPKNVLQALKAANIKCAKNERGQPLYFLFNCMKGDRTEEEEVLESTHRRTQKGMKEFTTFLGKNTPQKLGATRNVLLERIRLTACIQNLQERIKLSKLKQTEITQIKAALKKHEQEMANNENFTTEVDEAYNEIVPIDCSGEWWWIFNDGATRCTVCEENCHYPGCTTAKSPDGCEVMKGGHCTACTKKCPASDHKKDKFIFVPMTRKVKKTIDQIKEKYVKYKTEAKNEMSLLEALEKEMKFLSAEWLQFLEEAYQHVVKLDEIALNVHSLSTHVHLDFLIEKMKEKGDTVKVQKLEEMKRHEYEDEGLMAAMVYGFGKILKVFKK